MKSNHHVVVNIEQATLLSLLNDIEDLRTRIHDLAFQQPKLQPRYFLGHSSTPLSTYHPNPGASDAIPRLRGGGGPEPGNAGPYGPPNVTRSAPDRKGERRRAREDWGRGHGRRRNQGRRAARMATRARQDEEEGEELDAEGSGHRGERSEETEESGEDERVVMGVGQGVRL
jgi:hypothetical protein